MEIELRGLRSKSVLRNNAMELAKDTVDLTLSYILVCNH